MRKMQQNGKVTREIPLYKLDCGWGGVLINSLRMGAIPEGINIATSRVHGVGVHHGNESDLVHNSPPLCLEAGVGGFNVLPTPWFGQGFLLGFERLSSDRSFAWRVSKYLHPAKKI